MAVYVAPPESISVGSFAPQTRPSTDPWAASGTSFEPTPEGRKLLEYFQSRYKVPLELREVSQTDLEQRPELGGYFSSSGTNKSGYGGSSDPFRRVVNLNPYMGSAHVLAHEAGHAYDPTLLKSADQVSRARAELGPQLEARVRENSVNDPGTYLNTYIDFMGPRRSFQAEVVAQREARKALEAAGIEHPEREQAWYQGYPRSYIEQGIGSVMAQLSLPTVPSSALPAYAGAAFGNGGDSFIPGRILADTNTVVDVTGDRANKLLNLALNPSFQKAASDIETRSQAFLDRELGRNFAAERDPAMSFWGR